MATKIFDPEHEETSAIEQEIQAPEEVVIANNGLMAAEIFDPEHEEMSAIEQETQAPQEVVIANDGLMAPEIFDPEHAYEDGEPCAVHEAPLALTSLLYFWCRTGAARRSPSTS